MTNMMEMGENSMITSFISLISEDIFALIKELKANKFIMPHFNV